jgi:hypothetical protein
MSTRTARWLFQVCRKPDKTFPQRKPDGIGRGWIWKTGDVRKVLYRLPRSSRQLAAKTHPKIARHRHVAAHHACELSVLIAGYFGFVCALAHLAREMLNQFSGGVMELEPNKPE